MNKPLAIVGKVKNGRVTVFVASEDRIVGHSRPLRTNTNMEVSEMRINNTPVSKPQPLVKPVEPVEVPAFIRNWRNEKELERRKRELEEQRRKKFKTSLFDRLV